MEIDFFNYELAFLILLTCFVSLDVGPANDGLATFAKNVRDAVESSDERPVFGWSDSQIDTFIEKIGSTVSTMETLADNVVVRGQVGSTV